MIELLKVVEMFFQRKLERLFPLVCEEEFRFLPMGKPSFEGP